MIVMKYFIILSMLFICVMANLTSAQTSQETPKCVVAGSTLDDQGFPILGISILFSGRGVRSQATSNEGTYSVELEPGLYRIETSSKFDSYAYKRSKLNVHCNHSDPPLKINLFPKGKNVSFGDESPEYIFESIGFPGQKNQIDTVISYLKKVARNSQTSYEDGIMTYDNLTLSADTIVVNLKTQTIQGVGNAWLENGKERIKANLILLKRDKSGIIGIEKS